MRAALVLPNQLCTPHAAVAGCGAVWVVEEPLFFTALPFLQQKIIYTRAAMKRFAAALPADRVIHYLEAHDPLADIRRLVPYLRGLGYDELHLLDPADDWIERRLARACGEHAVALVIHPTPVFLNSHEEALEYTPTGPEFYQLDFYKQQRSRRRLLLEPNGLPQGGHWSYDAHNRKPFPRSVAPPRPEAALGADSWINEAQRYTTAHYAGNPGGAAMRWQGGADGWWPTDAAGSEVWMADFFAKRFGQFGPYQDAILPQEHVLFHSAITPMMNLGLLTPARAVADAIAIGCTAGVPLESVEGFVRQLVGWREYVRTTYVQAGRRMRTGNFFGFKNRPLPRAFWTGETGLSPVDNVVQKVLRIGWCHHIERLMVLGSALLLCEAHPDEVYSFFSALFVDAYDWVMVPNVYGMSQFADGGLTATKPYISSSAYLLRMGRYDKGLWTGIWDALFWRFLLVHGPAIRGVRRAETLPDPYAVLSPSRRLLMMQTAEQFLEKLWS